MSKIIDEFFKRTSQRTPINEEEMQKWLAQKGEIANKLVEVMNSKGSKVYVESRGDGTFDVKMKTDNDPYLKNEQYQKGEAYVHVSDKFYADIEAELQKISPGAKLTWNNTASVGWVIAPYPR